MKKAARLLIFLLTAVMLCSCASKMSDEEARAILSELVPRSQELNAAFWGDALKPSDENASPLTTVSSAQYYPVAADAPYQSVAQLKAAAEAVFSSDYLEDVYVTAFDGIETDDYKVEPRFKDDENGVLAVDITYTSYDFTTVIRPEIAHIVQRGDGVIIAEVQCVHVGGEDTMKITLRLQDGNWLIDSPTY